MGKLKEKSQGSSENSELELKSKVSSLVFFHSTNSI